MLLEKMADKQRDVKFFYEQLKKIKQLLEDISKLKK